MLRSSGMLVLALILSLWGHSAGTQSETPTLAVHPSVARVYPYGKIQLAMASDRAWEATPLGQWAKTTLAKTTWAKTTDASALTATTIEVAAAAVQNAGPAPQTPAGPASAAQNPQDQNPQGQNTPSQNIPARQAPLGPTSSGQNASGQNSLGALSGAFGSASLNPGAVQGVTAKEIRFGISAPFTGAAKELGRQMKVGIETAFGIANDAGGINGRQLKLIAVDDGYEPARTADTMKELVEKDHIFASIGNVGTPTAAVALPYALEHKTLFFGALTGTNLLRASPPDHYVFNYRPSYAEETGATIKYLVNVRGIKPKDIAVFAQKDSYGDAGYAGVTKALRDIGQGYTQPLLLSYTRNTVDVDEAVATLRAKGSRIKAVVMVAAYRAAAKFIEKTRMRYPAMIYTNVSFVGSTALADELKLLGSKYVDHVIVTQVVPDVSGYSKAVLDYKAALGRSFPGEAPDYISFEGYVDAKILIEGLKRAGPDLTMESLIAALESMHDVDLGLGTVINLSQSEHQGSHKIWGTELDGAGRYRPVDLQ